MASLGNQLREVLAKVAAASASKPFVPRLVAVSKTKPAEAIQELFDLGQVHFGENYVHEVESKQFPLEIKLHYIGQLQSNKVSKLIKSSSDFLWCVETITSIKLAKKLNNAWRDANKEPLRVLVQVNTSEEDSKGGLIGYDEVFKVVEFVLQDCDSLRFKGLMTIGAVGDPEGFVALRALGERICETLQKGDLQLDHPDEEARFELSMGMSGDFDTAIELGSSEVRVGSLLFGKRDYDTPKP